MALAGQAMPWATSVWSMGKSLWLSPATKVNSGPMPESLRISRSAEPLL